jgi:hypothetical protein
MWSWDKRFLALAFAVFAFDGAWTFGLAPRLLHHIHLDASLLYETDGNAIEKLAGPQVYGRFIEEHLSRVQESGQTGMEAVELHTIVHKLPDNELYWEQSTVVTYDKNSLKVEGGEALMHFPPHLEKTGYTLRMFSYVPDSGARFRFVGEDTIAGLKTYMFQFDVDGLDWTANYTFPLTADTRIISHDWGTVWIEPVSGVLVNHKEQWVASVDGGSYHGQQVDAGSMWFAADTVTKQVFMAQNLKRASILYEQVLPLAMASIGLTLAAIGVQRQPDTAPTGTV